MKNKFYLVTTTQVFRVWAEDELDAIQRIEDGIFVEADQVAEEDEDQTCSKD